MVSKSHLALLDHTGQVPGALPYSSLQSVELSGKVGFIQWVSCTVSAMMFVYWYHPCLQSSDACWRDRQVYQAERKWFSSWSCKPCLLCLRLQPSSRAQVYPSPDGLAAGDSRTGANSSWSPYSKAMRWNVPPPNPPSLQITAQESCCDKQNLKNRFWVFPEMAAQPEAVWYADPAVRWGGQASASGSVQITLSGRIQWELCYWRWRVSVNEVPTEEGAAPGTSLCHLPQGIAAVLKHTCQINGPINSWAEKRPWLFSSVFLKILHSQLRQNSCFTPGKETRETN